MVLNFIKSIRSYIIGGIILITLILFVLGLMKTIKTLKAENSRQKNNIENMAFDIQTTELKNGQLKYTVNSLTLKNNEIEFFAKDIYEKLAEMDIKLKNVKGVTNMNYEYNTYIDSIKSEKVAENKYFTKFEAKNFSATSFINTSTTGNPFLTDVNVKLTDTLMIVPEYQYKRNWLFWKKVTGVKVHITSENPNFKLNQVKTFEITK